MRFFWFFLLLIPCLCQAQPDSLFKKDELQVVRIHNWYVQTVRQWDSAHAVNALSAFRAKAKRSGDAICQAAAIYYEGQYRAVRLSNHREGLPLMEKGIQLATANNQLQASIYTHHLGFYLFFQMKDYSGALINLLRADEEFDRIGYGHVPEATANLYRLAFVYYHLGNFELALQYCLRAKKLPPTDSYYDLQLTNTIGQCYAKMLRPDSALYYYQRTYTVARASRSVSWVGIASGNIGFLYLQQQEYEKARPYYNEYYSNSVETKTWICEAEALTGLARIDLETGAPDAAMAKLKAASHLFDSATARASLPVENFQRLQFLFDTYTKLYQKRGDFTEAFVSQQRSSAIKDSINSRALQAGTATVREQVLAEKHLGEQRLLESMRKSDLLKRQFLLLVVILIAIIGILLYGRLLARFKRNKEVHREKEAMLLSENAQMHADLENSQTSLRQYTESLVQKTQLLQQLETRLADIHAQQAPVTDEQLDSLRTLTRASILTPEEWTNFRILFEKVHPDFFQRLKEKYPGVSPAETRVLALTRLGLSTFEMAAMLGVNIDTIKKTRQRLRKCLDLPQQASITDFVQHV
jgi:tetratricopeptide (TPR) repeat protein